MKLTLVRWNRVVNHRGPLGRRLTYRYIQETMRLMEDRARLEAAFERRADTSEVREA